MLFPFQHSHTSWEVEDIVSISAMANVSLARPRRVFSHGGPPILCLSAASSKVLAIVSGVTAYRTAATIIVIIPSGASANTMQSTQDIASDMNCDANYVKSATKRRRSRRSVAYPFTKQRKQSSMSSVSQHCAISAGDSKDLGVLRSKVRNQILHNLSWIIVAIVGSAGGTCSRNEHE